MTIEGEGTGVAGTEVLADVFVKTLLQGKVVVITGGGTGLGRAMGERFLSLGAKLVITGRREEVLKAAADEMDGEVLPVSCDVRDAGQVTALVDAAEAHFGRVDALVNNAAGNFISPTERLSPRAVDAVLNIVLHGTFYCTLELGKRWIPKSKREPCSISPPPTRRRAQGTWCPQQRPKRAWWRSPNLWPLSGASTASG